MRVVRLCALLMLAALAGCAAPRPQAPAVTASAPAQKPSQRQLVETPPPAPTPEAPLPALKPGTELSLADSEALSDQASPKGPPVEGEPTPSQKAMGRMAGQTVAQGVAASQAADQAPAGQPAAGQPAAGQPVSGEPVSGQSAPGQPVPGQPAASQTANLVPAGGGKPAVTDAAHLVGLSQADATTLFGPPAESKDLPPSKVWTYHSPVCDMKLFFYPEVGGPNFRALTYQIDERGASDATHIACLSSLAKPHAG